MKKIFIETSVFLRYLTKDSETKYKECEELFKLISEGSFKPYISGVVIEEILFVLTRIYKYKKISVLADIGKIFRFRNITIIDTYNTSQALSYFKNFSIKYGDCLIATQVPDGVALITYDRDFKKINHLKVLTPKEMLKSFADEK